MKFDFYDFTNIDLIDVPKEVLEIIGLELKRRRTANSRTLDSYEMDCSVSYISKLERAKIVPNYQILRDLCVENGITAKELNTLLVINEILSEIISAFLKDDKEKIKDIFFSAKLFENYKTLFIKMFYALSIEDYALLEKTFNKVRQIAGSFNTFDHNLYVFFEMVILNYHHHYIETYSLFIEEKNYADVRIQALANKEFFIALCKSGIENPKLYHQNVSSFTYFYNENVQKLISETYLKALVDEEFILDSSILSVLDNSTKIKYAYLHHNDQIIDELLKENTCSKVDQFFLYFYKEEYDAAKNIYLSLDFDSLDYETGTQMRFLLQYKDGYCKELLDLIESNIISYGVQHQNLRLLKGMLKIIVKIANEIGRYKIIAEVIETISKFESKKKNVLVTI